MKPDFVSDSRFFLAGSLIAGLLNISTFPYLPLRGVLLTVLLVLIAVFTYLWERGESEPPEFYRGLLFSFVLTVLLLRLFVNTAGIGTPGSTGSLGPLTITQIWVGDLHLHHYWIGVFLLPLGFFTWRKGESDLISSLLLGVGLAAFLDEFGIIVAGHTYHSMISHITVALTSILLFSLYLLSSIKRTGDELHSEPARSLTYSILENRCSYQVVWKSCRRRLGDSH